MTGKKYKTLEKIIEEMKVKPATKKDLLEVVGTLRDVLILHNALLDGKVDDFYYRAYISDYLGLLEGMIELLNLPKRTK